MTELPEWVALAWRLPAGLSTPRVTTWRNLQRLGAARLTPGAALLPFDFEPFAFFVATQITSSRSCKSDRHQKRSFEQNRED